MLLRRGRASDPGELCLAAVLSCVSKDLEKRNRQRARGLLQGIDLSTLSFTGIKAVWERGVKESLPISHDLCWYLDRPLALWGRVVVRHRWELAINLGWNENEGLFQERFGETKGGTESLSDEFVDKLAGCSSLTALDLTEQGLVSDRDIKALGAGAARLKWLNLEGAGDEYSDCSSGTTDADYAESEAITLETIRGLPRECELPGAIRVLKVR